MRNTLHNRRRQKVYMLPEIMQAGGNAGGGFWNNTFIGKGLKGYADGMGTIFGAPDLVQNSIVDNTKWLNSTANGLGSLRSGALNVAGQITGIQAPQVGGGNQQMPQQGGFDPSQMGYNPQMSGFGMNPMAMMGGMGIPGFGGGMMQMPNQGGGGQFGNLLGSLGSIAQLMQSIGGLGQQMKKGGKTKKYQKGGLVDIQAEKGELIQHPTGFITDVHASKSHSQMEKSGNGEMITDHPLDGSYILSDYLKLKKSDADDMIIGVKRFPYEEGKKGKEPILYTLGDLFSARKKKMTPAQIGKKVTDVFKVTNDKKDIFNILGDKLNIQNRTPYLSALTTLSEVEREKDDMREGLSEMMDLFKAKKGGHLRSRRIYQTGRPVYQDGPMGPYQPGFAGINPLPGLNNQPIFPQVTPIDERFTNLFNDTPIQDMGMGVNEAYQDLGDIHDPVTPIRSPYDTAFNNFSSPQYTANQRVNSRNTRLNQQYQDYLNTLQNQINSGNMITQYQNVGDPRLRSFGTNAIIGGAGLNTAANMYGAGASYLQNTNFINENKDFYDQQRGFVNRGRDISSMGTLFNVATQQAPEDMPLRDDSRLRQINPQENVNASRMLADQSIGQVNTLLRNRPNVRGINVGNAIAQNNQSVAQSQINANNQQYGIDREIDAANFQNDNITATNRQRQKDFSNDLSNRLNSLFSNESSRQMDMAGLNMGERTADVAFRQNRLREPIAYASAAGNSLANTGAAAYGLGNQYIPQQVPAAMYGQGLNVNQNIDMLTNLLNQLGVKKPKKGGKVKKK